MMRMKDIAVSAVTYEVTAGTSTDPATSFGTMSDYFFNNQRVMFFPSGMTGVRYIRIEATANAGTNDSYYEIGVYQ
jgi:hypothetical protein